MKILHADDDAVCREVIRLILEPENRHSVTAAADGEEAWSLLTDSKRCFDLALIDMMMPCLDGLALVERIRATPSISTLPVIFCTALNDRTTVSRAVQLGISHYIVKPYKKALVLEKIQLIEAEILKQVVAEEPTIAAERLGVPAAVMSKLVRNLLEEIRTWMKATKNVNDSSEFQRLAITANGFKGSCLNLGLPALTEEMATMETLLTAQGNVQQRAISLGAPAEITTGLQRVQTQLDRVIAAYQLTE